LHFNKPIFHNAAGLLELVKPRQSLLLAYTGSAVFYLASNRADLSGTFIFFLLGLIVSMGSNALNNYFDREVDGVMERTKNRPIPRGATSPSKALAAGLLMVAASTLTFAFIFNILSAGLTLFGAIYYVLIYTLYLKRTMPFGVVVGAVAGSMPILVGWAAASGGLGLSAVVLASIVFFWSAAHFWCLAVRYRNDYVASKLPALPAVAESSRVLFGIIVFNMLTCIAIGLSIMMIRSSSYMILSSLAIALVLLSTVKLAIRLDDSSAWQAYKISSPILLLIFTGLLLP
jgi:protoheme IX farnesyltransferase